MAIGYHIYSNDHLGHLLTCCVMVRNALRRAICFYFQPVNLVLGRKVREIFFLTCKLNQIKTTCNAVFSHGRISPFGQLQLNWSISKDLF